MASTSSIPRSNSAVSGRTIAVDVPPAVIRALGTTQNAVVGYQIYDPESGMFIAEGEWSRVESDSLTLDVVLPPERGRYLVYISALNEASGWAYQRGKLFLVLDAFVERGQAMCSTVPARPPCALSGDRPGVARSVSPSRFRSGPLQSTAVS